MLLLLEHNPVFTIGRMGKPDEILVTKERLGREGIEVYKIERGGSTTFHGPGQLVGYPIINLKGIHCSAVTFLRKIEEILIAVVNEYGIYAYAQQGKTGVWVQRKKIASIGIHVSHWITRHGFALNVCNSLHYFSMIIPCGMPDCEFASMSGILQQHIEPKSVMLRVAAHFARIFEFEYRISESPEELFEKAAAIPAESS